MGGMWQSPAGGGINKPLAGPLPSLRGRKFVAPQLSLNVVKVNPIFAELRINCMAIFVTPQSTDGEIVLCTKKAKTEPKSG